MITTDVGGVWCYGHNVGGQNNAREAFRRVLRPHLDGSRDGVRPVANLHHQPSGLLRYVETHNTMGSLVVNLVPTHSSDYFNA